MSKETIQKIKCSNCGKKFDATIFQSVNVDLDPELREAFLTDQLFVFECPHCKEKMFQPYPVLYHDMKHKFMVQTGSLAYVYGECYNFAYNNNNEDEYMQLIRKTQEGYKYVGALFPLMAKEKVIALENELDHRIVALYCFLERQYYNEYAKKNDKPYCIESFLEYDDEKNISVLFVLQEEESNKQLYVLSEFHKEIYEAVKKSSGDKINYANDFLFNREAMINFIKWQNSGFFDEYKLKQKYALILEKNGNQYFALIPADDVDKYKIEDIVKINADGRHREGRIVTICDYSRIDAPFEVEHINKFLLEGKLGN